MTDVDARDSEQDARAQVHALHSEATDMEARARSMMVAANGLRIQAYKLGTGFEVGDHVESRGRVYEITRFACSYDRPNPWGKWVLKDGSLGKDEREIPTWGSVRLVAKAGHSQEK